MTDLTLWKIDLSPPFRAVMILGDTLGLKFKFIDVNFIEKEHKSPEFLKINPLGTVPVLKDGDFILSDSHAMLKYLLSKYGGELKEKLYPSDVRTRAIIDQALFFDAGVYFIRTKNVALPTLFGNKTGPTEQDISEIESSYSVVEAFLGDKPYIAGDHLTIADISLGTTTAAMQSMHKLDEKKYPRTNSWLSRLRQNSAFKKHTDISAKLLEEMLTDLWEKNKQKNKQ